MSRPREFDSHKVRERLKDVFTAHGYNGTSLSMLVSACGLGKQSLYNSFGDKRALYVQTIDLIAEQTSASMLTEMQAAPSGLDAIRFLLDAMVCACIHPDRALHTCLMSAGLLEGIDDDGIAAKLRELWTFSERMVFDSLERGQGDGSIRKDAPAAHLSTYLMTLMSGMRVTARAVSDEAQLRTVVELGVEMLVPAGDSKH